MSTSKTIVINCAGKGTRLGHGIPKTLVQVDGKSILQRHLENLDEHDDIRVVVGFKADSVIEEALKVRRDVKFFFNHNYENTNTLESFLLGSRGAREQVVSIDGDLLVPKREIDGFLNDSLPRLGIKKRYTEDALCVYLDPNQQIVAFTREQMDYEWVGLCLLMKRDLPAPGSYLRNYMFEFIKTLLPLPGVMVECYEIDTSKDLMGAYEWSKKYL